jgi:hypothetical protein
VPPLVSDLPVRLAFKSERQPHRRCTLSASTAWGAAGAT